MRAELIESTVARLSCPPERTEIEYIDIALPGFGLRVLRSGRKTWLIRPGWQRDRRRVIIGPYPTIGAEEARCRAETLLTRPPEVATAIALPPAPTTPAKSASLTAPAAFNWAERRRQMKARATSLPRRPDGKFMPRPTPPGAEECPPPNGADNDNAPAREAEPSSVLDALDIAIARFDSERQQHREGAERMLRDGQALTEICSALHRLETFLGDVQSVQRQELVGLRTRLDHVLETQSGVMRELGAAVEKLTGELNRSRPDRQIVHERIELVLRQVTEIRRHLQLTNVHAPRPRHTRRQPLGIDRD
jgi:hypothetical protein